MAGSGGSLKEMVNRYNALVKPVTNFGTNLTKLKSSVERMNKDYWNGGQTANSWYNALKKAYKADKNFYNKMLNVQKKLRKLIDSSAQAAKVGVSLSTASGSKLTADVNITNTSTDDIFIDGDNIGTSSKNVKTLLANMCTELSSMKKNLEVLRDNPKLKGKVKKAVSKVASGVGSRYKKTSTVKNSLETSLVKSIRDYNSAMDAFGELDQLSEDLISDDSLSGSYGKTFGGQLSVNSNSRGGSSNTKEPSSGTSKAITVNSKGDPNSVSATNHTSTPKSPSPTPYSTPITPNYKDTTSKKSSTSQNENWKQVMKEDEEYLAAKKAYDRVDELQKAYDEAEMRYNQADPSSPDYKSYLYRKDQLANELALATSKRDSLPTKTSAQKQAVALMQRQQEIKESQKKVNQQISDYEKLYNKSKKNSNEKQATKYKARLDELYKQQKQLGKAEKKENQRTNAAQKRIDQYKTNGDNADYLMLANNEKYS